MNIRILCATLATSILLTACVPIQENPQFNSCADACSKKQNNCMVNAGTATEIENCTNALDKCVAACEQRYPRYLNNK